MKLADLLEQLEFKYPCNEVHIKLAASIVQQLRIVLIRSEMGHVIFVCDATKDRNDRELKLIVNGIRMRGDVLRGGDVLLVFGVLHRVRHPMGYQVQASSDSFAGTSSVRAMEEEVSIKVENYLHLLLQSAEDCHDERIKLEVKITAGAPLRKVVLQETLPSEPSWVILDRHLRRDLDYYLKHIPWKVALVQENLAIEICRPYATEGTSVPEHKNFYTMSKTVPVLDSLDYQNVETTTIALAPTSSYGHSAARVTSMTEKSPDHNSSLPDRKDSYKGDNRNPTALQIFQKQRKTIFRQRGSGAPILCATCGMRTELFLKDSMKFGYSEIQQATSDFSKENLLGEGGYGHVYKGELRDGQMIAAKVRKEGSEQGFEEFNSEVYVLSFARHKNIVMLLGYCCKENHNILVYEFICNKSLYWHLYNEAASILEWHHRYAIAIGTATGLRFLHEECRGGPIIHRDMRPSNILLTHDFVPMLGDFGLAKWKSSGGEDTQHTRILGTLGYLAPEYAESGIVSVRTDVYAFGVVLLQLISGRKVLVANEEKQSIRQWGVPLIKKLALHELIDSRLKDVYDTLQLYLMAKTAYVCLQTNPELRPSMGEVMRLLEGESDHFRHITAQFVP